jgi:hypothetical protein
VQRLEMEPANGMVAREELALISNGPELPMFTR